MEYEEGPDRPKISELQKLTEEIEDMEYEEKIKIFASERVALKIFQSTIFVTLIIFVIWTSLIKDPALKTLTIILPIIGLIASSVLFFYFKQTKAKKVITNSYFNQGFYAFIILFVALLFISIFKP